MLVLAKTLIMPADKREAHLLLNNDFFFFLNTVSKYITSVCHNEILFFFFNFCVLISFLREAL